MPTKLDSESHLNAKEAQEHYKLIFNILNITLYVRSPVSVYDKNCKQ